MSLDLTFALGQQKTFELRCEKGIRLLPLSELKELVDLCEQWYYSVDDSDSLDVLVQLGCTLYQWLDGAEGWLRGTLEKVPDQTLYLNLIQTSEAQGLNPETERVALGLAHLPWELLHDGTDFLIKRYDVSILPVRIVQQRQTPMKTVQNRPLHLLFMATAPDDPCLCPLDFEKEEANILQATERQPLALIVEESGSVDELANLVTSYPDNYFDVFHFTGHALIYTEDAYGFLLKRTTRTIPNNTPCFITEDEFGKLALTTVYDLAKAFRRHWPRLLFLSGCHTGQVPDRGTVPSMAQALIKVGAEVVLGWARPVYDRTGIIAAQALYKNLAAGESIEASVQATQREMIEQKCSDWHLLRMYRDSHSTSELVTPLRYKGRPRLKPVVAEADFLDSEHKVKVANYQEFVGRRRPIQKCLRALQETSQYIGVFIYGMGGLGKSTLAARLCSRVRMQRRIVQQVVLVGPIDEQGLLNKLSEKYIRFADVPALLNQSDVSLEGRLQNFFEAIETTHNQPLLLVLDDFEQNITESHIADGSLRITNEAYRILKAICDSLAENQSESRLIITCRYWKEDTLPANRLYVQQLGGMSDSDINKKIRLLPSELQVYAQNSKIKKIADGNPLLFEWLVGVIQQSDVNTKHFLDELEKKEKKFRKDILAQMLIDTLTKEEQSFLARLSIFNLAVSSDIAQSVVLDMQPLSKVNSLGLVEATFSSSSQESAYRVSRVLTSHLKSLLTPTEWKISYQQAAQKLYKCWWAEVSGAECTEVQALEIIRLGLLSEEFDIVFDIGSSLINTWINSTRFLEAQNLCLKILAKFKASANSSKESNEELKGKFLNGFGNCLYYTGNLYAAITQYELALKIACKNQRKDLELVRLGNLANCHEKLGEIDKSLQYHEKALRMAIHLSKLKESGFILNNMGICYEKIGLLETALDYHNKALEIAHSTEDSELSGQSYLCIGNCHATIGNFDQAINSYQQALILSRNVKDWTITGTTLHSLAEVLIDSGQYLSAIKYAQEGLKIGNVTNSPQLRTENNCALAKAYIFLQKMQDAYSAIQTAQKYMTYEYKGYVLSLLGLIFLYQDDREKACDVLSQAVTESESALCKNSRNYEALHTRGFSLAALSLCKDFTSLDESRRSYQEASRLCNHYGMSIRAIGLLKELEAISGDERFREIISIVAITEKI